MSFDLILSVIKKYNEIRCLSPADKDDILKAEKWLGVSFPVDLTKLLKISNGLELLMGHPVSKELMAYDMAYWHVNELMSNSHNMNKLLIDDKLNKKLLCFAGDGSGNVFCYIYDGDTLLPNIWVFYPITGELFFYAENLEEWAKNWFSGSKPTQK
jgi:cell wall assembly regulator SMI1